MNSRLAPSRAMSIGMKAAMVVKVPLSIGVARSWAPATAARFGSIPASWFVRA